LQNGTIKGLAVASAKRLEGFENLPTVSETLPGFIAGGWNVLLAPIGTPEAIINKVNEDMLTAANDKEIKQKLALTGAFVQPMSPKEVTAFAQEQQRTWRPIAEHVAKEAAKDAK
jgi:tripartite-type tricarboxylate transporter receptor subunit TctC